MEPFELLKSRVSAKNPPLHTCFTEKSRKGGQNYEHNGNKNRHHGDDSDFTNIIDMFVGYEVKLQGRTISLGLPPMSLL